MSVNNNEDEQDDIDNYMMLVRPLRNRKIPWAPVILAFIPMVLAIIALSIDEISDGDWNIDDSVTYWNKVKEIDFDCGWQTLRFTYTWQQGYETGEKYKYSSVLCSEDQDVFDSDWCEEMKSLGKEWLAFNIMGILFSFSSIVIVLKFGKASCIYFGLSIGAMASYVSAVGYWLTNEKCNEIEAYSSADYYDVSTQEGASLKLIMAAFGFEIFATLISSIYLCQKQKQRQNSGIQMDAIPVPSSENDTAAV